MSLSAQLFQLLNLCFFRPTCIQFKASHLYVLDAQAMVEDLLKEYPNVLTLRVRMPIVADLTYPRNFITKIIKYDKVRYVEHMS